MQLFIVSSEHVIVHDGMLILRDERVCGQLVRVLRAKPGYVCTIQSFQDDEIKRREVVVHEITLTSLHAKIRTVISMPEYLSKTAFVVALPNKWEKLELILQKLTEIGIGEVILCPTERSQFTAIPIQKRERWNAIVLEAAEQSWAKTLPKIRFLTSLGDLEIYYDLTVFDLEGDHMQHVSAMSKESPYISDVDMSPVPVDSSHSVLYQKRDVACGLVGPEGGLTVNDYAALPIPYKNVSLGASVLRTETAAIIGGWYIFNGL